MRFARIHVRSLVNTPPLMMAKLLRHKAKPLVITCSYVVIQRRSVQGSDCTRHYRTFIGYLSGRGFDFTSALRQLGAILLASRVQIPAQSFIIHGLVNVFSGPRRFYVRHATSRTSIYSRY